MFFASGLREPEGPVLLGDGSWLVVEMAADRGSVTQISSDGRSKSLTTKHTNHTKGSDAIGLGPIFFRVFRVFRG